MLWTNKVNNGPPGVSAGEGRYAAGENMSLPNDSLEICGFRRLPVTARVARWEALGHTRALVLILPAFLVFCVSCSRHSSDEPKTITFVDPERSHDLTERNVLPDERLQEFTRQSGIEVKHLPTPEPALNQLTMVRNLLKERSSSPDVLGVDVVWPGILSSDMIDLKPYFALELSSLDPNLVASYSIKGKLVAVPFHSDLGVLFYRKDLLREYGYSAPPDTWDQLEKMAARVQEGERAKGKSDFWGYVWPGAAG